MHRFGFAAISVAALTLAACGGEVLETRNLSTLPQNGFDGAYMSYFLPRGVVKFTLSYEPRDEAKNKAGAFSFTTDGKVTGVPDITQHYHAVYRHAGLSHDVVTIETTEDGLLKKVSSTSRDQSIDALKQMSEIVKQAIELRSAIEAQSAGPGIRKTERKPGCPKFAKEFLVDVTNGELLIPEDDGKLARFPVGQNTPDILDVVGRPACSAKFIAHLTGITEQSRLDAQVFPMEISAAARPACANDGSMGLCFRIQGGFGLSVQATLDDGESPTSHVARYVQGLAARKSPVGVVHFNRRDFVENTTTVEFTNGVLTKIELKDPSELVGFLSLPLEALRFVTILVKV